MRTLLIAIVIGCVAAASAARADGTMSSVQQTLKDQGFYYGEITGTKDADTIAAIRRYQIRNGLKVTGELNPETQKSLGVRSTASSAPATPPPVPRSSTPSAPTQPDTSDLRDDYATVPRGSTPQFRDPAALPPRGYTPDGGGFDRGSNGVFLDTPYENAPPYVQRQVLAGAQTILARQGYYRSAIDGAYGPGTAFALRAYQSRSGLLPSGRLDMETLAAFGLLPGERGVGMEPPRRRVYRRSVVLPGAGERIYIPR